MSRSTQIEQPPGDAPATGPPTSPPQPPARREKARSWFREHPLATAAVLIFLMLLVAGGYLGVELLLGSRVD